MLMIHESLMWFRALLSANYYKVHDLLLSKISLYYVYIPSWRRVISFKFSLFVLPVR